MNKTSTEREWYVQQFADFEKSLNGHSQQPLHEVRKKAIEWFAHNGFPTRRQEEWRFTNISPISAINFTMTEKASSNALTMQNIRPFFIDEEFVRLVFIDGNYNEILSSIGELPQGATVRTLEQAMADKPDIISRHLAKHAPLEENAFAALNTAFLSRGAFVHVSKNVVLQQPIHIMFIATDAANEHVMHPRTLIVADNSSQVQVIENYISLTDCAYFNNPVTEVVAAENAVVDHYKIQQESADAFHTSLMQIYQKRSSIYHSHNYAFGGAIARNDLNAVLDGEGAECVLNGLYLATRNQLIDNHSLIDHAQPHCNSHELYKGILDDKARAVFSGKIHVHPDAQKTDAIQSNQNLVLSDNAKVDTKPQLEIYADDVRCTHGGTVGQMDQDSIFYLRARGISRETARNIMIQAFAGEVAESIHNESIRDYIDHLVLSRLKEGRLS